MNRRMCALILAGGLVVSTTTEAHFRLDAPAAATQQDDQGNPQKIPPCGPNGAGTPTGAITTYQAGSTISITIDETVYHPGHYRVALAVNDPSELPPDPEVTFSGNDCDTAEIMDPPVYPVLADGMLVHTAPFPNGDPQSFQVTLPSDVTCDSCTLQVIQFMSNHLPGCFYYHCATIAIQEEPVMTTAASTGAGSTSGGTTAGSGGMDGAGGAGGDPGNPSDGEADEGCACRMVGGTGDALGSLALLLGLGALASRRRSSASGRP